MVGVLAVKKGYATWGNATLCIMAIKRWWRSELALLQAFGREPGFYSFSRTDYFHECEALGLAVVKVVDGITFVPRQHYRRNQV